MYFSGFIELNRANSTHSRSSLSEVRIGKEYIFIIPYQHLYQHYSSGFMFAMGPMLDSYQPYSSKKSEKKGV